MFKLAVLGHASRIVMLLFVGTVPLSAMVGTAAAESPPGVVVNYSHPSTGIYLGNPSIAILPNGNYVASHDAWGPGHPYSQAYLFGSEDAGLTWDPLTNLYGQYESTLFVHDQSLYIMGGGNHGPDVAIRRSTDGGQTWTVPNSATTGQLLTGGNYNMGATPVVVHDDRIWRAVEEVDPNVPPGLSTNYRSFMMSAPADADLLNAANWTASNSLLGNDFLPGTGWYEGGAVVTPQGDPAVMLRTALMGDFAALLDVSADGTTLSYDAPNAIVDFRGGANGKFTVRFDETSGRYWSLVNDHPNPGDIRNVLSLASSPDLTDWVVEAPILSDPDPVNVGFQYADFQFEGDDIIAVSRTAFDGAPNFHDSNYITFHRVPQFRRLGQAETVTLDAVGDAEIDAHLNWRNATKGIPHPEWSHTAESMRVRIYDPTEYPPSDPNDPPLESWALIEWDLSSFAARDTINDVTLEVVQWDGHVFATDVYGIVDGDWDESTVTWNNWVGTEAVAFLGTMTNAAYPPGVTTFSDPDLTAWVQDWVDGDQANYGLLLKWAGPVGEGDTYAATESSDTTPQLVIDFIPAPELGDVNGDGVVNHLDVNPLIDVVLNGPFKAAADMNQDGQLNGRDVDLFVAVVSAGSAVHAVPEPAALALAAIGLVGLAGCGWRRSVSRG